MSSVRYLGLAVVGGVLLGLTPGLSGRPGEAGFPKPSNVPPAPPGMIAESETVLPPDVVLAAFASNLTTAAGGPLTARERGTAVGTQAAPNPERLQPFEIAALLGQELPGLFQANLTEPIQRALTPPSFSVSPEALNLTATVGAATTRHRLRIDSLGGTVNWRAGARMLSGTDWLSILPDSGTTTPSLPSVLGVEVNYGALGTAPGLFQGLIAVRDADTGYLVTVPVVVALGAQQSRIVLSDSSVLLSVAGGGLPSPPHTIQIFNRGVGVLNWFVPVSALEPWLNLSSLTGTAGVAGSFLTLSLNNTAAQA
ncbi:MAG: BACON domain-containing protein, partial [Terriglobia bacterium]